jgi:hypothetical protein
MSRIMQGIDRDKLAALTLVAYMGEDEHGSGQIGIKQGLVPAGMIPIVAVGSDLHKLERRDLVEQFQRQADASGKPIAICEYRLERVIRVIEPKGGG